MRRIDGRLSYTPHKKIAQILQTKGNKMAEFTYGANKQRVKMVLKNIINPIKQSITQERTKRNYAQRKHRELHYIDGSGYIRTIE